MGKLAISQELSDKISNSLRIKLSDIDSGSNKPIIRNVEPSKKDSPIKKTNYSPTQPSPIKHFCEKIPKNNSHLKTTYKLPKQNSPIKHFREELPKKNYPIKKPYEHPISYPKKSHKTTKKNKVNYMKISKIVFISSIVGGIGITLGIKLGTILFL